jgi:hypothetical protein
VNSPEIKAWLGAVVGKEAEDLSRHDKWLCMMYPRLRLLKEFLTADGVIFVSIDDNEAARLTIVFDEIFRCRIASFIWKRRQTPDSRNINGASEDHEYILCYGRTNLPTLKGAAKDTEKYQNADNDPRGPWMSDNLTGLADATERPNFHYVVTNPETAIAYPPHPTRGWAVGPEKMSDLIRDGKILWPKSIKGRPRIKRFLADLKSEQRGSQPSLKQVRTSLEPAKSMRCSDQKFSLSPTLRLNKQNRSKMVPDRLAAAGIELAPPADGQDQLHSLMRAGIGDAASGRR